MQQSRHLTPQEMNRAVSLAAELLEHDTENKSIIAATEEVGVPPEYMTRAVALIQAEKLRNKATAQRRFQAVTAAICVAVAYWAVQSISRSMRAPVDSGMTVRSVGAGLVPIRITAIAVGIGVDLVSQNMNEQYPTTVEFHNMAKEAVQLYQLDIGGNRQFTVALPPLGVIKENTWFTHPWLITDENLDNIGVVYPPANPSRVNIQLPNALAAKQQGYIVPMADTDAGPVPAASFGKQTAIELVNMTGGSVDLYRVSPNGERDHTATLADGAAICVTTQESDRWLADGDSVQETFKPTETPNVALIGAHD
jgi:hypothetical protein